MAPNPTSSPTSRIQVTPTAAVPAVKTNNFVLQSPYSEVPLCTETEIHELIFRKIREFGKLPAVTCGVSGTSISYGELLQQSQSFGAALTQAGYKKGDVVAVVLPNCWEFPVVVLGCWSAGLTVVSINPRYTDTETLRQFQVSHAKVVVTDQDSLEMILKVKADCLFLTTVILTGDHPSPDYGSFAKLCRGDYKGAPFSTGRGTNTKETLAWLPFSSGTTGPPKLAMCSHAMLVASVLQFSHKDISIAKHATDTGAQERLVAVMPFFHIYGMVYILLIGLYQGCHIMVLPKFEPESYLKVIRTHEPTILHLVTPLISHIVNSNDYGIAELNSVHSVFAGAAPIGSVLINRFIEKAGRDIFFMEAYGMTEVTVTHALNSGCGLTKIGSCGRLLPSAMARVVDMETEKNLGPNQKGEIFLKGAAPALGYFRNEEATRELLDKEGWAHTGDIGYYDEDGYFYVVDRIKELIKVNVFQVAPSELEDLLRKHPQVADCAVIGVPSEKYGEVPRAYVVPKPRSMSEQDIHSYINPLVASYKQLKGGVEFLKEIAKSPSGKILRRVLLENYKLKTS